MIETILHGTPKEAFTSLMVLVIICYLVYWALKMDKAEKSINDL